MDGYELTYKYESWIEREIVGSDAGPLQNQYRRMAEHWLKEQSDRTNVHLLIERMANVMQADFGEAWLQAVEKVPKDMLRFIERPQIDFVYAADKVIRQAKSMLICNLD